MENRLSNKKFLAIVLLALLLCWMTFDKLIGIRFTNPDDMYYSIVAFNDYFKVADSEAKIAGRIGMYYATVYNVISAKYWDTPILDFALYGSLSAVLLLILIFARYLGHTLLGLLFVTLYLSVIPVTFEFNLLVSYPLRYTSGIILWLLSLISIEKYFRSNHRKYIWFSCVAIFFAYSHHETLFVIFSLTSIIYSLLRMKTGSLYQRLIHKMTYSLLLTSIFYITIFVAWYAAHPTSYSGNTMNFNKMGWVQDWANSAEYFIKASLPLFHYFKGYALVFIEGETGKYSSYAVSQDIGMFMANIQASQIARGFVVMALTLIALGRCPSNINRKAILEIAVIGLAILILPAMVISISTDYQGFVQGGWAPLHVTFFGFFGSIVLICLAMVVILNALAPNARKVITLVFALLVGGGALFADVFNAQVAQSMKINSERWNVAATLIRYAHQVEMPKKIIAPKLFDYVGKPGPLPRDYWQRLFNQNAGVDIEFSAVPLRDSMDFSAKVDYDCPNRNDCLIIIKRYNSQTVEVISTTPRPRFLKYSTGSNTQVIKLNLVLRQQPTFLRPGIFTTLVPLPLPMDMSMVKIL